MAAKKPKGHEYVWVRFKHLSRTVYVCGLYRAPSASPSVFHEIKKHVDHLNTLKSTPLILILGDLNTHNHSWLGSLDGKGRAVNNPAGTLCETTLD